MKRRDFLTNDGWKDVPLPRGRLAVPPLDEDCEYRWATGDYHNKAAKPSLIEILVAMFRRW